MAGHGVCDSRVPLYPPPAPCAPANPHRALARDTQARRVGIVSAAFDAIEPSAELTEPALGGELVARSRNITPVEEPSTASAADLMPL